MAGGGEELVLLVELIRQRPADLTHNILAIFPFIEPVAGKETLLRVRAPSDYRNYDTHGLWGQYQPPTRLRQFANRH